MNQTTAPIPTTEQIQQAIDELNSREDCHSARLSTPEEIASPHNWIRPDARYGETMFTYTDKRHGTCHALYGFHANVWQLFMD